MSRLRGSLSVVLLLLAFGMSGCGGNSTWIEPPTIDADGAAKQALELYDSDSDGKLSATELDNVPGIKAALKSVDTDSDGQVSETEIAERIRSWQEHQAGLTSIMCDVLMNGQPLEGATVTFEPESFLGDDMQSAVGVSTRHGAVSPSIPKENRPSADTPPGLQLGFFRVRVSKVINGKEMIPSQYNTETTLGQQVAPDDPAVINRNVRFNLKSR